MSTTHFNGVDSATGYTVNGTTVIDSNGKIIESAGISIANGDTFTDTNSNEMLEFTVTASATNHLGVVNSATGNNPILRAEGEANTGITFDNSEGEEILILDSVATSVNELTIASAATGNNPTIAATGEANTGITFQNSEGEEILILDSIATSVNELTIKSAATGNKPIIAATGEADNGIEFHNDQAEEILILASAATSVNEVTVTSAATGVAPSIAATGGDTNIDLSLDGKGTGGVLTVKSVETVAATNAITAAESGKVFVLSDATEFASTLPAPAAGLHYRFVIGAAPDGADYTVVTNGGANIIEGLAVVNGATVAAANEDTITFTASAAVVGDWCEVVSDGTSWFVSGQAQAGTGIAFTAT